MGILLLRHKPSAASRYMHLASEDVITSLLFGKFILVNPNTLLRHIVNRAVGREVLVEGELDYCNVEYWPWKKVSSPPERRPFHRLHGQKVLFDDSIGPKEGDTEIDMWIDLKDQGSVDRVITIEMKLLAPPSSRTDHDPGRDQLTRNLDVLWAHAQEYNVREFFFILIDNKDAADPIIVDLRDPLNLSRKLKFRDQRKFDVCRVSSNVGWINYRTIREIVIEARQSTLTTGERIACDQSLVLLEDVIERHSATKSLFPEEHPEIQLDR